MTREEAIKALRSMSLQLAGEFNVSVEEDEESQAEVEAIIVALTYPTPPFECEDSPDGEHLCYYCDIYFHGPAAPAEGLDVKAIRQQLQETLDYAERLDMLWMEKYNELQCTLAAPAEGLVEKIAGWDEAWMPDDTFRALVVGEVRSARGE